MEKHNVSRLVGAPPGYIGYEEGGQLTEKIRRKPYSVVLLDEIEKAHPDVWNMLLQIMEEGHLTDNVGRKVDFKNAVVILTTNVGAETIIAPDDMSNVFTSGVKKSADVTYADMKRKLLEQMGKVFRPEFLNRLDDTIVFRSLTKDNLKQIVDMELAKLAKRLKEKALVLDVTDEAKEFIIEKGSSVDYGARPLRRAVEQFLEDGMSDSLLRGEFVGKDKITVRVGVGEDGEKKLTFEATGPEAKPELMLAAPAGVGDAK